MPNDREKPHSYNPHPLAFLAPLSAFAHAQRMDRILPTAPGDFDAVADGTDKVHVHMPSPLAPNELKLTTRFSMDTGVITQDLLGPILEGSLTRWVMETHEAGIREALIQLGWTPPPEKTD